MRREKEIKCGLELLLSETEAATHTRGFLLRNNLGSVYMSRASPDTRAGPLKADFLSWQKQLAS